MKRLYEAPEFEMLKCILIEDVLSESYEKTTVPSDTAPTEPTGDVPDFDF